MPPLGFPVLDPGGMFRNEQRRPVLVLRGPLPPCSCRGRWGLYIDHPRQVTRFIPTPVRCVPAIQVHLN